MSHPRANYIEWLDPLGPVAPIKQAGIDAWCQQTFGWERCYPQNPDKVMAGYVAAWVKEYEDHPAFSVHQSLSELINQSMLKFYKHFLDMPYVILVSEEVYDILLHGYRHERLGYGRVMTRAELPAGELFRFEEYVPDESPSTPLL